MGEELSQSLENEVERAKTVFDEIMQLREPGYWKQAEAGVQRGARDGKSGRQRRRDDKEGRDKDLEDAEIQDTYVHVMVQLYLFDILQRGSS